MAPTLLEKEKSRNMSRKTFMPEAEIQDLERMTKDALMVLLSAKGPHKIAQLIDALLRSYRLAATVANVAWKLAKEAEHGAITPETFEALQAALADYSPGNFAPPRNTLEYACRVLEDLYDRLLATNTPAHTTTTMVECLFNYITELQTQLQKTG